MKRNRIWSGTFAVAGILWASTASQASTNTLWYSGDFDGQAGYINEVDTSSVGSNEYVMFERFDVTDPNGWNITTLWSGSFNPNGSSFSAGVTQAEWSIRSEMGSGNAGTILFSGTGPLTLTPTGRGYVKPIGTNFEYRLEITGLNIYLPQGVYWMNVTPYTDGGALITSTVGANAIGTPSGSADSGLWWWSDGTYDYDFTTRGFSMGVGGSVAIPEPASWLLTVAGALVLWPLFKRRR